jgi:hypothetical protein
LGIRRPTGTADVGAQCVSTIRDLGDQLVATAWFSSILRRTFQEKFRVIDVSVGGNLRSGADVNAQDYDGKNALDYAKDKDRLKESDVYKLLQQKTRR